jgi:hypothetical protein
MEEELAKAVFTPMPWQPVTLNKDELGKPQPAAEHQLAGLGRLEITVAPEFRFRKPEQNADSGSGQ